MCNNWRMGLRTLPQRRMLLMIVGVGRKGGRECASCSEGGGTCQVVITGYFCVGAFRSSAVRTVRGAQYRERRRQCYSTFH